MRFFPICLAGLVSMLLSCGCSDSSGSAQPRTQNLPDTTILSVARADAIRLIDASGSEFATIGILLDIRAKESLLRSHDLDATADLYISHIRETIKAD